MSDPMDHLHPAERREIRRLAAQAEAAPEVLLAQFAAAFVRLAREVPGALPPDPMRAPMMRARGVVK